MTTFANSGSAPSPQRVSGPVARALQPLAQAAVPGAADGQTPAVRQNRDAVLAGVEFDPGQIEQVLVNLVVEAGCEALDPRLRAAARPEAP